MKSISKLLLSLTFTLLISTVLSAQNPNFTIQWNSNCEVQSTQAKYRLTYTIVHIPTQTPVFTPVIISNIPLSQSSQWINIDFWSCDRDELALNYLVYAKVERVEPNGDVSCTGEIRSSYKKCSELYDGLTFTVQMYYP